MILFNCDYSEGAHADILRKLAETNMEQTAGYGEDPYCEKARDLIATLCHRDDLDIHFLVGGTQTTSRQSRQHCVPTNASYARIPGISMSMNREPWNHVVTKSTGSHPRTAS